LSATFHGRDLFAPVAATLATGGAVPGAERDPAYLRRPGWPDDLAEIIYVDTYGNAITGVRAAAIAAEATITAAGVGIPRARTFSEVPAGSFLCYENANGLIEIAANQGRAVDLLRLEPGSPVKVTQV
jgi:S-adenosylmethionine hydrolase